MNYVYVVTERTYKRAYHAEPLCLERVIKVYGDYHSTVVGIRDLIIEDHARLDKSGKGLTYYKKYEPNLDEFTEGDLIDSFDYSSDTYVMLKSYRFKSYDVE